MRSQPLRDMRVLVVEDEYYMADDLARALKEAGAIPVGPFGSVHQAESAITQDEIRAAVLDLNLHGERSDDLARRLDSASVPCLIVSGYGADALPPDLCHLRRLEKPINCSAIVSALGEEVARAAV